MSYSGKNPRIHAALILAVWIEVKMAKVRKPGVRINKLLASVTEYTGKEYTIETANQAVKDLEQWAENEIRLETVH